MSFKSFPDARLSRRDIILLLGISLLSVGIYFAWSGIYFSFGFPLDDAWIHQTYARNLALHGEWAFIQGIISGGSTAPLWSTLLALGHVLGMGPYAWTITLGILMLWGLALLGERMVRNQVQGYRPRFPWIGGALALEWHLVWAAGSGMEILLSCTLAILVFSILISKPNKMLIIGLLIGVNTWVRPDGITLLAPAGLVILLSHTTWKKRFGFFLELLLGFGGLFALYILFNLTVCGYVWPNTFFAKQAEYSLYLEIPFLKRLGQQFLQPLIGIGIVLIPGVIWQLITSIRNKNWDLLLCFMWTLGFCGLYAIMLPVTYQHGRYVIPAMPAFFIFGLIGLADIFTRQFSRRLWAFPFSLKLTTLLILVAFYFKGGIAYSRDVAFIESEMVTTAKWVSLNIPREALVAAHDIGALGYFGNHAIVDLAGLISPEVIPFIRDETLLQEYLDIREIDYLITFPDWYPVLVQNLSPVFSANGVVDQSTSGTNMTVYKWPGED